MFNYANGRHLTNERLLIQIEHEHLKELSLLIYFSPDL